MSVTKDKNTGKWMSQIRIKDWTEKEIHKKKRGFSTKKEALQWERDFINQANGSLGMSFMDFIELYLKDMENRLKPSTVANKRFLIDLKIIPYFGKFPMDAIKPTDIRRWQNELTNYRDENGKPYSQTYLKTINKSYQCLNGKDIISSPKTPKSNRVVTIPEILKDTLRSYMDKCYRLQPDDRLFPYTKSYLYHEMEYGIKESGVKRIRVHDIRHGHASLLVEMGFSPLLIAERLRH